MERQIGIGQSINGNNRAFEDCSHGMLDLTEK